jgi:hypothetical protein
MQQKLQKLFSLFLIATSIISCQQEEEFVQNNQYLSKINQYKVQRKTFDDLLKDNRISSFAKKYQSESVFHKSNANNRIIYANDGSFSIDTEQSIYIEDPETSSTSYTFQVSRSETDSVNNNYLENIVISFPSEGYYQITLIRYELTDQEKEDIENGYVIDLSDNIIYTTQLDDIVIGSEIEGRFYVNQNGNCFTLIEETCNCYTHTDQTGYEDCLETCHNEQVVWTFCNEEGGGGTTAQDEDPDYDENGYDAIPNTGNDTNTGSNDPSSGSTNSDNQSNTYPPTTPINTSPFYTDLKAKDRIRNFKTHLSFDQNIFLTNNPDIKNEIYNYLENQVNDLTDITYPQDAIDFIIEAILALMDGECAILPTVFNTSEIEADFDPNLFGDYLEPTTQQNHDAIQQQFEQIRSTNGNLAAVNYLINTYNMNTFGADSINYSYSISFVNELPNDQPAITLAGYDSYDNLVSIEVKIDINLFSFTDFGFITRVIKHELLHVLQYEHYPRYALSDAVREFDAYYAQIFQFRDLKQIQNMDLVCQLSEYLLENMNQLSISEKSTRQNMINRVNQTFPKICP